MLKERSYQVTPSCEVVSELWRALNAGHHRPGKKIKCCWIETKEQATKVGKKQILELISKIAPCSHLMIVTSAMSVQAVAVLKQLNIYFEVLGINDIISARINHSLVPKYRLLSEFEILDLEKRFGGRNTFNKMIAGTDYVARYMDFRPGDVLETTYVDDYGETLVGYRLVMHANDIM